MGQNPDQDRLWPVGAGFLRGNMALACRAGPMGHIARLSTCLARPNSYRVEIYEDQQTRGSEEPLVIRPGATNGKGEGRASPSS
ncbi:hypothetical protein ACOSQ2_021219 [Xanthoceras sorbifolium]